MTFSDSRPEPRRGVFWFYPRRVRCGGIDFWPEVIVIEAITEWDADTLTLTGRPVVPIRIEKSEWWRRLGFYALIGPVRFWRVVSRTWGRGVGVEK